MKNVDDCHRGGVNDKNGKKIKDILVSTAETYATNRNPPNYKDIRWSNDKISDAMANKRLQFVKCIKLKQTRV